MRAGQLDGDRRTRFNVASRNQSQRRSDRPGERNFWDVYGRYGRSQHARCEPKPTPENPDISGMARRTARFGQCSGHPHKHKTNHTPTHPTNPAPHLKSPTTPPTPTKLSPTPHQPPTPMHPTPTPTPPPHPAPAPPTPHPPPPPPPPSPPHPLPPPPPPTHCDACANGIFPAAAGCHGLRHIGHKVRRVQSQWAWQAKSHQLRYPSPPGCPGFTRPISHPRGRNRRRSTAHDEAKSLIVPGRERGGPRNST